MSLGVPSSSYDSMIQQPALKRGVTQGKNPLSGNVEKISPLTVGSQKLPAV